MPVNRCVIECVRHRKTAHLGNLCTGPTIALWLCHIGSVATLTMLDGFKAKAWAYCGHMSNQVLLGKVLD